MGFPVCYDPLPWFWSDQFTVNIQIYGVPKSHHRVAIRRLLATQTSLYFYLEQDRLKAVVGVNAPRELAMARRLIEKQTAVMAEVLEDPDQSIPRA
ncbi:MULTISPECIES: oxidoreductase C-terminal domain-containing protein [unclassified Variovorax]|uniref:oxidoreductase C-terminal domain-containing protein n=1 Tax=unclassified Variovorax TaxID=663243 RepID=UPI001E46F009|nr:MULTISPECIES: oxidoreductase C-terminal domain-containing protein [unclassified Variovorax]